MNTKEWLHKRLPLTALILSLLLFVLSMASNNAGSDTEKVARNTAEKIEDRLEILERYIEEALETDRKELILPEGLPEDMVIYRYINDSLQSWSNQFSIINDDITSRLVFQRLTDRSEQIISPLTDVTEEISYLNFGPKWYLVKSVNGNGNQKIICGLEIKNTLIDDARRNENGVNPRLKLSGKYSVLPLTNSGGSAVEIDGKPQNPVRQQSGHPILRQLDAALDCCDSVSHRYRNVYGRTQNPESLYCGRIDPYAPFPYVIHLGTTDERDIRTVLPYHICRRSCLLLVRFPSSDQHLHHTDDDLSFSGEEQNNGNNQEA